MESLSKKMACFGKPNSLFYILMLFDKHAKNRKIFIALSKI